MEQKQVIKVIETAVEKIKARAKFENFNVEFNIKDGVANIIATEKRDRR